MDKADYLFLQETLSKAAARLSTLPVENSSKGDEAFDEVRGIVKARGILARHYLAEHPEELGDEIPQ